MSPATESTEYSPFFLLFGKEMNLPFDIGIQPKPVLLFSCHNSLCFSLGGVQCSVLQ
jgi:hypothetical protein